MRILLQNRGTEAGCSVRHLPDVGCGSFVLGSNLSRWVDEFSRDFEGVGFDVSTSFGRTDVYEKDKQVVFEMELPGMRREDIRVSIEDDHLSIAGEVKRREEVERDQYFRMGRRVGRFQRSFPLPTDLIDKAAVVARFEDGILRVSAPLRESIKEREKAVEIKVE